jgi:hypothetical protein
MMDRSLYPTRRLRLGEPEPNDPASLVYRSPADIRLLGEDDEIEGGDVLPGF